MATSTADLQVCYAPLPPERMAAWRHGMGLLLDILKAAPIPDPSPISANETGEGGRDAAGRGAAIDSVAREGEFVGFLAPFGCAAFPQIRESVEFGGSGGGEDLGQEPGGTLSVGFESRLPHHSQSDEPQVTGKGVQSAVDLGDADVHEPAEDAKRPGEKAARACQAG